MPSGSIPDADILHDRPYYRGSAQSEYSTVKTFANGTSWERRSICGTTTFQRRIPQCRMICFVECKEVTVKKFYTQGLTLVCTQEFILCAVFH